jgi:cytochrome b
MSAAMSETPGPSPLEKSVEEELTTLKSYKVWDKPTRLLHALNLILIFVLLFTGYYFVYRGLIHIDTKEAKMGMKTFHSLVGYVFAIGLVLRLTWGFLGNRYARWAELLPGKSTPKEAISEAKNLMANRRFKMHLGHGPLGRFSSTLLLLTGLVVASSGLVRAGTDLYMPPFGGTVAAYVAREGLDPSKVTWRDKETIDPHKQRRVYKVSLPMGRIHWYGSWVLIFLIVVHVLGVIVKEIRTGGSIFSSMVTGRKLYRPEDVTEQDSP